MMRQSGWGCWPVLDRAHLDEIFELEFGSSPRACRHTGATWRNDLTHPSKLLTFTPLCPTVR